MSQKKGRICVFFRVYNDTDHLSPVAWRLLREGYSVDAVLIDKNQALDPERDPRLSLLRGLEGCRMYTYYSSVAGLGFLKNFCLARLRNSPARKIAKKILSLMDRFIFSQSWADKFIGSRRPAACIFDPCETSLNTLEGKLIAACKKNNVPLVCLPHGAHFLTSYGEGSEQSQAVKSEDYFRSRDVFDVIVEPNPRHELGAWDRKLVEQNKIRFLGSARYCPEWFALARNFWPDFKPAKSDAGKLKVVFFLPRWEKTVNREGVLKILEALAYDENIYLAVKEHTREGAGNLPAELYSKLDDSKNTERILGSAVDSVALVRWCDAAVNIRGSIGLEVILQEKILINPKYLHKGRTIFEDNGAGIECRSFEEFLAVVERCRFAKEKPVSFYDSSALIKNSVYAGKEPVDVLSTYTELVASLQRE